MVFDGWSKGSGIESRPWRLYFDGGKMFQLVSAHIKEHQVVKTSAALHCSISQNHKRLWDVKHQKSVCRRSKSHRKHQVLMLSLFNVASCIYFLQTIKFQFSISACAFLSWILARFFLMHYHNIKKPISPDQYSSIFHICTWYCSDSQLTWAEMVYSIERYHGYMTAAHTDLYMVPSFKNFVMCRQKWTTSFWQVI